MFRLIERRECVARAAVSLILSLLMHLSARPVYAQTPTAADDSQAGNSHEIKALKQEVRELRELVLNLQAIVQKQSAQIIAESRPRNILDAERQPPYVADNEASVDSQHPSSAAASISAAQMPAEPIAATESSSRQSEDHSEGIIADAVRGMTINALLDAYYEYNFNEPIGRVNYLRAYDVSSNNFSLNQADFVLESAPDLDAGKRFGIRIDLQFGQATETLQGSSANELRPEIYRNIFQAYGTYVIPIRDASLTLDFGKWASSLGIEGNYTKDQMNYSRSFWFNFLPFYHAGLRADLKISDQLAINYWVVNGTDQTEAFNNYKDQMFGFVVTPIPNLSWTFNYYLGMEHPDIAYVSNPGPGQNNLPMQQGMPFMPIANAPNGKLRIADSYLSWQASSALTLALETDYVTEQLYSYSRAQRATGGAVYARYQLTPRFALAGRGEYVADTEGLYSGSNQYLSEQTLTAQFKLEDSFIVYGEWRRDASNRPYFLSDTLDIFASHQTTLGLGFVWWVGQKQGAW